MGPARSPSRRPSTPTTPSVPISTDNVYGVASLIFWSVMIIVTLTYVTLVMRADNDGGGSIMALITLLRRYGGAAGSSHRQDAGRAGPLRRRTVLRREHDHPCDLARVRSEQPEPRGAGGTRRRRVGADNRRAGRRRVRGPADDLERYHYAWAGGRDVVGPGTTIQRDPRDGEPWVRAAMFSLLEATRDRGRELAAGGKGKP